MHIGYLDQSVQAFQDKRGEIYGLIDEHPALEESTRKSMRKFIDKFYDVLDDPKRLDRDVRRECI